MRSSRSIARTIATSAAAIALLLGSGPTALAGSVSGSVEATPSKYQRDVVVFLEGAQARSKKPTTPAVMDQKGMVFIPHVLPIVRGTTVRFLNSDKIRHNVFSPDHEKYNLGTWPQGQTRAHTFKKSGVYTQLCNVHPEMEAYIVVLDTPYFAVTGKDGSFTIEGVPAGTYTLKVWSEKRNAAPQAVTVGDKGTTNVSVILKR